MNPYTNWNRKKKDNTKRRLPVIVGTQQLPESEELSALSTDATL